jgi:hypothetical protein
MSGTQLSQIKEHLFLKIAEFLDNDLDTISREQLDYTIRDFEQFTNEYSQDQNVKRLQGLISQIIPHFYRSRGFADPDTPRNLEYYQHMQQARNILRVMKNIIESVMDDG